MALPSIEDLLGKSKPADPSQTPNAPQQLVSRMQTIALAQLEKATEQQAAILGIPFVNLKGFPISQEVLRLLPRAQAEALQLIPFFQQGEQIRVGAVDPKKEGVTEAVFQLGERARGHAELYLISPESLKQGLKLYESLPVIHIVTGGVEIPPEDIVRFRAETKTAADVQRVMERATVTDIVAALMASAVEMHSSDIHIEAEEKDIAVRFRLDGVLQDIARIPKERWMQLISRVKLVSGLKINFSSGPQDGRFTIFIDKEKVDVRVSTLPTSYGERIVLRILDKDNSKLNLSDLGMNEKALVLFSLCARVPRGFGRAGFLHVSKANARPDLATPRGLRLGVP